MEHKHNEKPNVGRVYQSLNSSDVRKNLYEYLGSIYPRKAFLQEIKQAIGYSETNLKGACHGGNSFSAGLSLVSLGLAEVEEVRVGGKTYEKLGATEWGHSLQDRLKDYRRSVDQTATSKKLVHTHTLSIPGPAGVRKLAETTRS